MSETGTAKATFPLLPKGQRREKREEMHNVLLVYKQLSMQFDAPLCRCLSVVVDIFPFVLNRESVNDFLVVVYHFLFDSQLH